MCDVKGLLAPTADGFSGEITRSVIVSNRYGAAGVAEQTIRIFLSHLSADLMSMEGTGTGDKIIMRGKEGRAAANVLNLPSGATPSGPWHFTFQRAK
jgi:hypothetical protein